MVDGLSQIGDLERVVGSDDLELIDCTDLTPDLQASIERRIVAGGDEVPDRIRRSWVWVDYAAELLGSAAAMWLRGEMVGDLSARNMTVALSDEGFEGFYLRDPARDAMPAGTERAMHRILDRGIGEHAAGVLQRASASSGVGPRNLWGSVADAIVHATIEDFRTLGGIVPVERLAAFLDARPELSGKGEFIVLGGPRERAPVVGFHRSTCCLWFRVDPGQRCGSCMLSTREEVERDVLSAAVPMEGA